MACNCGKRTPQPRRSAVLPRQNTIISSQNQRNQIQSLSVNEGLSSSRRTTERKRRETVLRKLGRI